MGSTPGETGSRPLGPHPQKNLMYQLPDQYLTEDEIADREARQQQCASCGRDVEADIAVELDYCSACGHEIERP